MNCFIKYLIFSVNIAIMERMVRENFDRRSEKDLRREGSGKD